MALKKPVTNLYCRPNQGTDPVEAVILMHDIKTKLIKNGIWFTISEVYEQGLKFIKIEASVKVKE